MHVTTGNEAMCYGKKVFLSYYQADRSAHGLNRKRDNAKANIYKCPHCHWYHVGNSMGKVRRPQSERFNKKELELDERI